MVFMSSRDCRVEPSLSGEALPDVISALVPHMIDAGGKAEDSYARLMKVFSMLQEKSED